jgi:hypothetical protein
MAFADYEDVELEEAIEDILETYRGTFENDDDALYGWADDGRLLSGSAIRGSRPCTTQGFLPYHAPRRVNPGGRITVACSTAGFRHGRYRPPREFVTPIR